MALKAEALRRPVAPTLTMMIIAGVRMVMAMGDKSGSNESGRWGVIVVGCLWLLWYR